MAESRIFDESELEAALDELGADGWDIVFEKDGWPGGRWHCRVGIVWDSGTYVHEAEGSTPTEAIRALLQRLEEHRAWQVEYFKGQPG